MIPDFQTLMRPALAYLSDGETRRSRDVKDAMADEFRLTDLERAELLPSGRQRTMDNRVGWALTYLSQAGLVRRPSRGQVQITDVGRAALHENPARIDMKVLDAYPSYLEFKERTRERVGESAPTADAGSQEEVATPNDLLEKAVSTNRAAVEGEVLQAALRLSPAAFEDLVIELLRAMGYGVATRGWVAWNVPVQLEMLALTASSARTHLGLTAYTCRPSDTPRTVRLIVHGSTSSRARFWASRATAVCTSRRLASRKGQGWRQIGSTPASSSSTDGALRNCS